MEAAPGNHFNGNRNMLTLEGAMSENRSLNVTSWTYFFLQGLEKLGTICELVPNPANESDPEMNYPPIILGFLGSDESKKTLLVYGHLDVMPAAAEDGWCIDDPFKLEEIDGKLYGRGTTDDKGPVLGWLAIIQAYQQHNMEIPVNLKVTKYNNHRTGTTRN